MTTTSIVLSWNTAPKFQFKLRLPFFSRQNQIFTNYTIKNHQKSPRSTINAQFGGTSENSRNNSSGNRMVYRRLDSCLVIPPSKGRKPKALIKFLGGAFIGAVPEVTYSYFLENLAKAGYLIISVPYNVTFDHERVTRDIYQRFHSCLDSILLSGLPEYGISGAEIADLPFYSVGHSNGALLQVLTGSFFSEKIPKANAIISYNNRPASEAVPYFEQVAQGISEFKPTPAENLDCFKKLYSVQHTLLVKFGFDAIDETDLLLETLKPRIESYGGKLEKVVLSGNHITPCIQEPRWQVGPIYTPADAIVQGIKSVSLNDTTVLSTTIANWFSTLQP